MACGSNRSGGRKEEPAEVTQGWLNATLGGGRNLWPEGRRGGQVLTRGRYVGASSQENDGELFGEKMQRLVV